MEGAMDAGKTHISEYKRMKIYRPQYPHIEKWIDAEFGVIYINQAAQPGAKIVRLITNRERDDADGL